MPQPAAQAYSPLTMHQSHSHVRWRPGIRQFPWMTAAALISICLCIAALTSVIVVSDGQAVSSWRVQPAVCLAIIASIANASIAIAFSRGATVAWWRTALRGTTLSNLEQTWALGRGDFNIKLSLKQGLNRIALVAIMVILATTITNPLLQRASHVRNGYVTENRELMMDMLQSPLAVSYGQYQLGVPADTFLFLNFISSVQRWYSGVPIYTRNKPNYSCNGTCKGVVNSPGLRADCYTGTSDLDMFNSTNQGSPLFSVAFNIVTGKSGEGVLRITSIYSKAVTDCVATIVTEQCDVSVGMFQQPIIITNQTIQFNQDESAQLISNYSSPHDSINLANGDSIGPLYALFWLGEFYFLSNFTLNLKLGVPNVMANGFGGIGVQFVNLNATAMCDYTYSNPIPDILQSMTEVLFRMVYEYDVGVLPMQTQIFAAFQSTSTLMYYSEYYYFGAGIGIMFLTWLALFIPLWGWWDLGRRVTLSPIEIAKAFGAPMLKTAGPAAHTDELVDEVGHMHIKYGKVMAFDSESGAAWHDLGFGAHETVMHPTADEKSENLPHSTPAYTSLGKNSTVSMTTPLV